MPPPANATSQHSCGAPCVKRSLKWLRRAGLFVSAVLAVTHSGVAVAQTPGPQTATRIQREVAEHRSVAVTQNKSTTIRFDRPFSSTVVGATDIADVLPMSDQIIYIQGKKIGTTNVSVFDVNKRLIAIIDVDVRLDAASVQAQIRTSTGNSKIRVSSANGQLVLSGEARDAVVADRAMSIAKTATPNATVVNAMNVASSQQVMLSVRFIEASRDAGRQLGVNIYAANGSGTRGVSTGLGVPTQVGQSPSATPGGIPLFQTASTLAGGTTAAPFGVGLASIVNSSSGNIDVLISALETKGIARRLAEPDLVALSGDTASFLAGGEIPVPSVQSSSSAAPLITVEYKPFGVQLTFVPTVLANGMINLRLTPSVSELDYTNAVTVSGFLIPALTKREARTTIELRDGQSFAIAGLLQTEGLRNISQVPWLGSVPVLGALFRSAAFQQRETDLVVIVTPHLVQPAVPGEALASPLDDPLPGNDADLFVLGKGEIKKKRAGPMVAGTGSPYGYIMPSITK
jgi:pilus assembly protein CpaC